jgi:hypothetical protein
MKRKKTKLPEKASRVPDLLENKKTEFVKKYIDSVSQQNTESAKAQRFLLLLKDLFGDVDAKFIEDYLTGTEKYIKEKTILSRGEVDTLYGNMIIEFERDVVRKFSEAQKQLIKYASILWSKPDGRKVNYICVATDGLKFFVYSPKTDRLPDERLQPADITLEEIEKVDLSQIQPYQVYFWLDRYFLRKEPRPPTTEEFVKDFGMRSPAFKYCFNMLWGAWQKYKERSDFKVIYENWEKYLRIAYGTTVADETLFIRHTYLATFAKLMVRMRLAETKETASTTEILEILKGDFFKKQGIENFLEEDFFSWVARWYVRGVAQNISQKILNQLLCYNLRELSEDVLKSLYQELVDPETRHDLGEYYTPDWLAQRMVEKSLDGNPKYSVLDPACGSGTFLYLTIKHKRSQLGDSTKTLEHILDSTVGIDIHPLAVIIAKTTYLLGLGDVFKKRKKTVQIPIYLADSINLPEQEHGDLKVPAPGFHMRMASKLIHVPIELIGDPQFYDQAIEICKDFALSFARKTGGGKKTFGKYIRRRIPDVLSNGNLLRDLTRIANAMRELIEEEKDTIWAFILKNVYKPLFLKGRFDVILGNPPWLSYRYVEKGEYQNLLKNMITQKYKLLTGKVELLTHMELATLFFLRTADIYLKPNGTIGFVLPRSIFTSDQHNIFRRSLFPIPLGLVEAWDLEKVKPLFNVPACVIFGQKNIQSKTPLPCEQLSGELSRKNANLDEAKESLQVDNQNLFVVQKGSRSYLAKSPDEAITAGASEYRDFFKQGATIVPRSFWFVEIKPHPSFGFDPSCPFVQTSEHAVKMAKETYKDVKMEGNMEKEFLYATLLSTDIAPFGFLDFRLVVLPIKSLNEQYQIIDVKNARRMGFLNLGDWLEKCSKKWNELRGEKAKRESLLKWLDYRKKLSNQRLVKYKVLYPTSATYLCGCVVENKTLDLKVQEQTLCINGLVVDYTSYYFETNDKFEAFYLVAVLNAPVVDRLIKPMQARGAFGPRHICKKVLELPIPKYDSLNEDHKGLVELGELCTMKVKKFIPQVQQYKSIGHIRRIIREELKDELKQIDGIVERILTCPPKLSSPKNNEEGS